MKRSSLAIVLSLLFSSNAADASTFDDAAGAVRLDLSSSLHASLDSAAELGGLPVRVLAIQQRNEGYLTYTDASDVPAFVADGVEGKGALSVAGNRAVLLGDDASLAAFAGRRIEVSVWVHANGAQPELRAIYGKKPLTSLDAGYSLGRVIAFRTGRATSDGWIELSTGPIDGSFATAPMRGLLLSSSIGGGDGASFSADALEIRTVDGPLLGSGVCTLATEATACAKGAACIEGICVDSAIVYAPLLPLETRKDVVARTLTYLTRFEEDRHAALAGASGFAKVMPGVALSADTAAAFYRPLAASFGAARGAHSFAPGPNPYSRASAGATTALRYNGSELNACFGLVDKDVSGGGRGYGVYATATGSPLHVGDVVTSIDGESIDAWLARMTAELGLLAADPDSDGAYVATELHGLFMRYGKDLVVDRCSASGCASVAIALDALRKMPTAVQPLTCSTRFKLAVDVPAGGDPNAYEAAFSTLDAQGVMNLHTNGEPLDDAHWVSTVSGAFDSGKPIIVDKRRGDGGGGSALETWAGYMRRGDQYGLFFVSRVDHAAIDGAPGTLDAILDCDVNSWDGRCALKSYQGGVEKPGALQKVAWLNVLDGSASDMATYYAKGQDNVRIFAPNHTAGLFGSYGVMGGFLPGWSGGSVQITDVHEGNTPAERHAGGFRSGHGIAPDEVVVQRQSDLLVGKDTMLERAHAWLAE